MTGTTSDVSSIEERITRRNTFNTTSGTKTKALTDSCLQSINGASRPVQHTAKLALNVTCATDDLKNVCSFGILLNATIL